MKICKIWLLARGKPVSVQLYLLQNDSSCTYLPPIFPPESASSKVNKHSWVKLDIIPFSDKYNRTLYIESWAYLQADNVEEGFIVMSRNIIDLGNYYRYIYFMVWENFILLRKNIYFFWYIIRKCTQLVFKIWK